MLAFDYYFLRLTLPQLKGVGAFRSARLNEGQLGGDDMARASVINGVFHMGCFGPNHWAGTKTPDQGHPRERFTWSRDPHASAHSGDQLEVSLAKPSSRGLPIGAKPED